MNKLPAKQIYLLSVIIVGIIALSVYSTYALFTFESSTSDIVSIHTPKSLTISENVYEYQQLVVEPNTVTTTDVNIYNSYEYESCYSVWYKIIGDEEVQNKVQIFEKTDNNLMSSGTISPKENIKITIAIINDNDTQIKINLGTIGASKDKDSCSLNIASDKHVILSSYKNIDILTTKLLEDIDNPKESEAGYITYKELEDVITFKDKDKISVSTEFTIEKEVFTLKEPEKLTIEEIINKYDIKNQEIYFCQDTKEQCRILYKITEINKEIIEKENTENNIVNYHITMYDKLIGYSEGTSGLRKINEKDYVYYGDNPNNYIYYNCQDNDNIETCELWRVVGFFYNEETNQYNTKIVRNESIGKYQFDTKTEDESTNDWNNSTLNKQLNEEYKLSNNYDIYIDEYIQLVERIPDLEVEIKNIKIKDEKITSKISLLSLSDYLYASSCEKNKINEYSGECFTNNWLNNIYIEKEWTMTSKEIIEIIQPETPPEEEQPETEETTEEPENNIDDTESDEVTVEENEESSEEDYVINYVYSTGINIAENDVNESLEVRPVVFLKSRIILLEGNGSFEEPYIVK